MIAMLRIFDNYHNIASINEHDDKYLYPYDGEQSVSGYYYKRNTENRNNMKKYLAGLSYKNTTYRNQMAQFSSNKNNYEFVVKNNIDWSSGKYITNMDNNPLIKTVTKNLKDINATKYISGIKSDKEFLSNAQKENTFNNKSQKYSVVIQNEFLKENHLKSGDTIQFTNTTKFKIAGSVKFNEVTYPMIGHNFVSDIKKTAFVGINLTDYISLVANNDLVSRDASFAGFYFGINSGYDKLNKLST